MDEREKAEHEALAEMFQSPGWAVLARNTQVQLDAFRAQAPFNMKTLEELWFARGTLATLETLIRLPDSLVYAEQSHDDAPTE